MRNEKQMMDHRLDLVRYAVGLWLKKTKPKRKPKPPPAKRRAK